MLFNAHSLAYPQITCPTVYVIATWVCYMSDWLSTGLNLVGYAKAGFYGLDLCISMELIYCTVNSNKLTPFIFNIFHMIEVNRSSNFNVFEEDNILLK